MKLIEMFETTATPHLYLDMDGVQADFFTAWAKWHSAKFDDPAVNRYKDIGDRERRDASIAELTAEGPQFIEDFFAGLGPLPGGMVLVRWLKDNGIPFTILSAPLRDNHEASIAGKKSWLDQYNPGTSGSAIFTGVKEKYAKVNGQPNILVDDHKKYITRWEEKGGKGILYRDDQVNSVIEQLKQIYDK